jgi:hypothetical protein
MQPLVENCDGNHCRASPVYVSQDSDGCHTLASSDLKKRSQSTYAVMVSRTVGIMGICKPAQHRGR